MSREHSNSSNIARSLRMPETWLTCSKPHRALIAVPTDQTSAWEMPLSGPYGLLLKGHTNAIGHGYIPVHTRSDAHRDHWLVYSDGSTQCMACPDLESINGFTCLLGFIASFERRIQRTRLPPIEHNTASVTQRSTKTIPTLVDDTAIS